LSPAQQGLLDELAEVGFDPVRIGWPYRRRSGQPDAYRVTPLALASVRNGRQYLAARNPVTRDGLGRLLSAGLAPWLGPRARRPVLLLVGSCGMQFLAATSAARSRSRPRLGVLAFGPVGQRPAGLDFLRVAQGRSDWISRVGWRGPVHGVVPAGHLDYLGSTLVRRTALSWALEFKS
jgi:hypothetical protein